MKPIRFISWTTAFSLLMTLLLSSCDSFLSENPESDLVEPNTPEKIRKLLVGAYSTSSISYITELSSDNIYDDGTANPYTNTFVEAAAYWSPVTNADNIYDAPYRIWQNGYKAIAHANEALESLRELGEDTSETRAIRGEALVARAWAHFQLANVFCLPYDPTTSTNDLGVPYVKERVVNLQPDYPRGTMASTYEQIASDLEEGIKLLEKNPSYFSEELKKFHFVPISAQAFAARFYLYYQSWDKAEEYATKVLGNSPAQALRDWSVFSGIPHTDAAFALSYYDIQLPANLLTIACYSTYHWMITGGTSYYNTRFAQAQELTDTETLFASNIWGKADPYLFQPFIYTEGNINKTVQPKYPSFPSSSSQTMDTPLTTDETLLVRAEARIHQKKYDEAVADLNLWTSRYLNDGNDKANPRKKTFTKDEIIAFYQSISYDSDRLPSLKKKLTPHFAIANEDEEMLLHHLLQCRRILTLHEGLRWQDIKRYGIVIYRRRKSGSNYSVATQLDARAPRHAIQLPTQAVQGSIIQNPS